MDYELRLDERCPLFVALGSVVQIQNVKIALQTVDYERRGGVGNNTQRFSCFHHSSQKCKSVLHVVLSLEQ